MKILAFSGSLRTASLNKKLITAVSSILSQNKMSDVQIMDLKSFLIPVYDGDLEEKGIPSGVQTLGSAVQGAEALIIASPEYNGAIAGSLKNTIDWLSRLKPVPLEKKPVLLMGASPGALGSIRALGNSRAPFESLGSFLFPQSFGLSKAHEAFDASGNFLDQGTRERMEKLLTAFLSFAKGLQPF